MPGGFVIDNSVLSACYRQNWMGLLEFRAEEYQIVASKHIWEEEFLREFSAADEPDWMEIVEASQYPYFPAAPRSLGVGDLSCLGLANATDFATVTNDKQFYDRATEREIDVYWGTDFLIQSFLDCGISQEQFDEGKRGYVKDVFLPEKTKRQVLTTEKQ